MEIKNVTTGYLNEIVKTGIVENGQTVYRLERENIGSRICIIDGNYAVDIDDFSKMYEIIKRDNNHRILNKIDFLTIYAFETEPVDDKTMKSCKKRIKQYKKLNH